MNKRKLLTLLLSSCSIILLAQPLQVISSGGSSFEQSTGSISFTMGECIIQTYSNPDMILTQGFHQPDLIIIDHAPVLGQHIDITAFPNPANKYVILKSAHFTGLFYTLYDLNGRIIEQKELFSTETEIDFSPLPPSTYLLKVNNNKTELSTFKITKQ